MKITKLLTPIMLITALAGANSAVALPMVDKPVETGSMPVKLFPDHEKKDVYWYIPISVDPWDRDSSYKSSLYRSANALSVVYRGQPRVEEKMMKKIAKDLGVPVSKLVPISYEETKDLVCQNFYANDPQTQWLFPSKIGSYLEVVPMSLRTTNPEYINEIEYHLENGGLACTVSVAFKGVSTAYKLKFEANMNEVFRRFEANAHAQGFFWEVDIHTLIQKLHREKIIKIESYQDDTIPDSEFKAQLKAAWDEVVRQITANLFKRQLQLPTGSIEGRGKPWSLRTDYKYSEENNRYVAILESSAATLKKSQISIRMAVE